MIKIRLYKFFNRPDSPDSPGEAAVSHFRAVKVLPPSGVVCSVRWGLKRGMEAYNFSIRELRAYVTEMVSGMGSVVPDVAPMREHPAWNLQGCPIAPDVHGIEITPQGKTLKR